MLTPNLTAATNAVLDLLPMLTEHDAAKIATTAVEAATKTTTTTCKSCGTVADLTAPALCPSCHASGHNAPAAVPIITITRTGDGWSRTVRCSECPDYAPNPGPTAYAASTAHMHNNTTHNATGIVTTTGPHI